MTDAQFWAQQRVLITGHTGFKGSWLALWLKMLGAKVHGVALAPDTTPSLYHQLGLESEIASRMLDIRDGPGLTSAVREIEPSIIFHLAAQAIVLRSYAQPVDTWATNVMGTAHVLQAVASLPNPCSVVAITTDKVYQNREWVHPYRESDRLGGHDPYAASKAASEILLESWRKALLHDGTVRVAAARAGNVIGGGDWAEDRIVPDVIRSLAAGSSITVRNPSAIRPWQHVLDPLQGYLALAEAVATSDDTRFQSAFNFGPDASATRTVQELVEEALKHWPGDWAHIPKERAPHEAGLLSLATDKARHVLNWRPRWGFEQSVRQTVEWYRAAHSGAGVMELCRNQISEFSEAG